MNNAEGIKSLNKLKIREIFENILMEDSVLNYPVEKLAVDFFDYSSIRVRRIAAYLKKLFDELEHYDWVEELEKYAKEPFSKITVLVSANILVFVWMLSSGIATDFLPKGMNSYLPVALGAENEGDDFSGGLRRQDNKILEPQADLEKNSFSEIKCEKDKEEGRCSSLCADIEEYIKVTKDMSDEEKRAWQKYLSSKPKLLPSSRAHTGVAISCSKDTKGASRSDTKGKHMDEDCCPDPDEWPKPGCRYSAAGLSLMMKGPK